MEFRTESIESFNHLYDTTLHKNMTFAEAVEDIEMANNNYFYVSACKDDVIEAINKEDKDLISQLDLELVFIDEVGVYIALQP